MGTENPALIKHLYDEIEREKEKLDEQKNFWKINIIQLKEIINQ